MYKSIILLSFILVNVVILSVIVARKPSVVEDTAAAVGRSTMSLRPYRFNQDFETGHETYPRYSIDDFLQQGYHFLGEGKREKAEDIFKTALLFDPNNTSTLKTIGELSFMNQEYEQACNYFTQYLKLKPFATESYTNLAIATLCAGGVEAAEEITQAGLRNCGDADAGPFYFILSCISVMEKDIVQAEAFLQRAYDALGRDILKVINANWAAPVRELQGYRDLIEHLHESPEPETVPSASHEPTDIP